MGLSKRIFIGLGAGICAGLFFGELTADLKVVGELFIKLLQMTVLPYIVVSLIAGFGRMTAPQARRLAVRGSLILLLIWAIALALIFIAPLAFPELDTASFFSSRTQALPQANGLLELYVPFNIFYSLSNNLVPAVVLFSILMGVALIPVQDKGPVLAIFDGLSDALVRINGFIVQLTPYGIFAIAAAAAGTMTIDELGRVQVYLITYISLALFITFWIFPGLVSAVSGVSYREVLDTFKDALVTAFATGNQFVVLPLIAENCKTLLASRGLPKEESEPAIDVIVPVSFNFPSLGKMLVLLFVLFAAWFSDRDLAWADRLELAGNGLLSLFGSINIAVPHLLDRMQIPTDLFQLFLITGVVVGRFGAMLAALHIIVLSVLGTLAVCGQLYWQPRHVLRYLLISALGTLLILLSLRAYFEAFVPSPPTRSEVLSSLESSAQVSDAEVFKQMPARVTAPISGSRLTHILDSGQLRVGYRPNNLPCTFLGSNGQVVGFDAAMAHSLASDLDVSLSFVPFEFTSLGTALSDGRVDIAMSCIASLPERYRQATYSNAYLDLTLSLVVPDHRRRDFNTLQAIAAQPTLSIALVSSHYFSKRIRELLPEVVFVELESAEAFFSAAQAPADALLLSAEEGSAYAFRYPRYTVVNPMQTRVQFPAGYAMPRGENEWHTYVDNWIDLKRKDGSIDQLYHSWIMGGVTENREPRWSILKDVLGREL